MVNPEKCSIWMVSLISEITRAVTQGHMLQIKYNVLLLLVVLLEDYELKSNK